MVGPGFVISALSRPHPVSADPCRVRVCGPPSAAARGNEPGTSMPMRRTAATAAALRAVDMQHRDHRMVLKATELAAVNLKVPCGERLEPIHILAARNHIDHQVVRGDGERVRDIDGHEDELHDLPHLDGEG